MDRLGEPRRFQISITRIDNIAVAVTPEVRLMLQLAVKAVAGRAPQPQSRESGARVWRAWRRIRLLNVFRDIVRSSGLRASPALCRPSRGRAAADQGILKVYESELRREHIRRY